MTPPTAETSDSSNLPSIGLGRLVSRTGMGMLAFLTGSWVTLGRTATEKIATALAMPCGLVWFTLICVTVYAVSLKHRTGMVVSIAALVVFTAAGNGFVASGLSKSLEGRYANINPFEEEPFDAIVVLGGGAKLGANSRSQGNTSGDRLILAAQLYHQGKTSKLICTGKRIVELNNSGIDPADHSAAILQGLGVPEHAIEKLGGRNTSEEMVSLGERFGNGNQRVGLLTSAWHLPRATRLASKNGFDPTPLPADFATGPGGTPPTTGEIVLSIIPQADALTTTTKMCKERLGAMVGR